MQERTTSTMAVEGMACTSCAEAVRRAIRRLDPEAEVTVDLDEARVTVTTCARARDIVRALAEAGYTATAAAG